MNKRLLSLTLVALGATVFVSSAQAQGRVMFAPAPVGRTGAAFSRGGARANFLLHRGRRFFAASAFAPYFYPDYDSELGLVEAPPPQIIEQPAQPASPAPPSNPVESLVLELQGDHWVRITNYGRSQTGGQSNQPDSERAANLQPAESHAAPRTTQPAEPLAKLPPAVLVFRDGHKEEIGKYLIKDATIYTSADYWSSASWTRKARIADLDVPATLKLNEDRGAKFSLPSGPNEVMFRP